MRWTSWLVLGLLAAAVYILVAQPLETSTLPNPALALGPAPAARASAFEQKYASDFLTYTNEQRGYQLAYPLGYAADEDADNESVRFTVLRSGPAEIIQVIAGSDVSLSEFRQDFQSSVAEFNPVFDNATVTRVNGQDVEMRVALGTSPFDSGFYYLVNAYYACTDQGFNAVLLAVIPADLALDLEAVNFMIHSFRCSSGA